MDRPDTQFTLLEATRIVARGSELDSKLDALAGHAVSATGAIAVVVYLFDPLSRLLVAAAQAGLDEDTLAANGSVSEDDPAELVARVVRERIPSDSDEGGVSRALAAQHMAHAGLVALPLVAADEWGSEDAEGVLLAAFDGPPPDALGPENLLPALADLCAIAIRQARLESALMERADWIGRLASTDALTGLANRTTFERMLELEIARATRQETQVSVVLFDVDDFEQLNRSAGAQAGDEVLRHVAATLAGQVRVVDTIARYGPDEFAVIAPGGGGEVAGRRIRDALAQREAAGFPISVSAAAVVYPQDGGSSEELLAAAGRTLARAKQRGRGTIAAAREA